MKLFNWIDKLIASPTKTNLMILNNALSLGIPFNAPHGFKIKEISENAVAISVPNRKLNHNHLGGIHACAIATVGEYCAGMSLLSSFGASQYRLILSELNVKYSYQGRTNLVGSCSKRQIDSQAIQLSLNTEGKHLQTLETIVRDVSGNEVALVTTTWQIKAWNQVKTKT